MNDLADLKKENRMLRMFNATKLNNRIESMMKERIDYMTNVAFFNAMESSKINIIAKEAPTKAFEDMEYVDDIVVLLLK